MKFLLDTHIYIWSVGVSRKLSDEERGIIADTRNEVYVSCASLWEAAIKAGLNKLTLPDLPDTMMANSPYEFLHVTPEDAFAVRNLPLHHRDPFDRMLIAQAMRLGLTLVTRDPKFRRYNVRLLEA